ncbi:MAG: hypothetical protein V7K72_18580, partial [Nostoc sp.]|uniref:hypothetical protein n=1 Tax=Nostoc sp. TaxID=1180 RepID=UPI002FFCB6D9
VYEPVKYFFTLLVEKIFSKNPFVTVRVRNVGYKIRGRIIGEKTSIALLIHESMQLTPSEFCCGGDISTVKFKCFATQQASPKGR